MLKQFFFSNATAKTKALRIIVCLLCILVFLCGIVSVSAAENGGWVRAQVDIPDGFEEHIIVCMTSYDTGEEYAIRIMAANNYDEFFQLPPGKYAVISAFLENMDFRYTTELTSGNQDFIVPKEGDLAVVLTFETTLDESIGTEVRPTERPTESTGEATLPDETTPDVTPGSQTGSGTGQGSGQKNSGNSGESGDLTSHAGNPDPEGVITTKSTTGAEESTAPTMLQPAPGDTENQSGDISSPDGTQPTERMGTYFDLSVGIDPTETEPGLFGDEEVEEPDAHLTLGQKIFFTLLGAGIFTLIVFVFAFFYRRYVEEN